MNTRTNQNTKVITGFIISSQSICQSEEKKQTNVTESEPSITGDLRDIHDFNARRDRLIFVNRFVGFKIL